MRRRGLLFAPALISASAGAQAAPEVDLLLVLSMDAAALIAAAPYRASERVIDVAGDGPDMRSIISALDARDAAVAQGITINGLAIEIAPVTRGNEPLHVHYERNIMGGPGAFVMVAETRRDFARALRAKMLREIA
jgi:hypothetical protein